MHRGRRGVGRQEQNPRAIGYLTKDAGQRELLAAVRAAAAGQAVFQPEVSARLVAGFAPAPPTGDLRQRFPTLTAREADVLALIARGEANPQIAALYLSTATVKSYVTAILAKLDVTTRAQAIALALTRSA